MLCIRYIVRRVVLHACLVEMAMLIATCRRRQCRGISGAVRSSVVERNSRGWYCVARRGGNPIETGAREVFLRSEYVDLVSFDIVLTSGTSVRKISRCSTSLINPRLQISALRVKTREIFVTRISRMHTHMRTNLIESYTL